MFRNATCFWEEINKFQVVRCWQNIEERKREREREREIERERDRERN